MTYISVKTAPGRVAFTAPRGGQEIPNDRFVAVPHTAWIDLLITKHGDLVVEESTATTSEPVKAAPAAKKGA